MHHVAAGVKNTARNGATLASGQQVKDHPTEDALQAYWDNLMGDPYESIEEATAGVEAGYGEMTSFLNSVAAGTNIEAMQSHPAVGPMNCLGVALFQRAHDNMHLTQLAELKASPGFPRR